MDINTSIEVICHRSTLEKNGKHSQLEHVLDGLAVIALESFRTGRKNPEITPVIETVE